MLFQEVVTSYFMGMKHWRPFTQHAQYSCAAKTQGLKRDYILVQDDCIQRLPVRSSILCLYAHHERGVKRGARMNARWAGWGWDSLPI